MNFIIDNFEKLFNSEDSLKKLEEIILDLAVKGKLVSQDPTDEPVSVLLEKIKEEKEQLIKEKKIKKDKDLALITEEEIPFEIPSSWEWVRLGEIGNIFNGNSINEKEKKEKYEDLLEGFDYISTKDVDKDTNEINYNNGVRIPKEEPKFKYLKSYSVLICAEGGSAGKKIAFTDREICFGNKLFAIEPYENIMYKYIFYNYKCNYFYNQFSSFMTGIIGGISSNNFKTLLFPLPPLAEQNRIVEKVDKLKEIINQFREKIQKRDKVRQSLKSSIMNEIEKSNSNHDLLENLELIFRNFDTVVKTKEDIKDIRDLVLSMAVKGKLVPQDSNDEQINKNLGKDEIEIPFEIPYNWEKVSLLSISKGTPKNGYSPKCVSYETNTKTLSLSATTSGIFKKEFFKYIDEEISKDSNLWLKPNDILIQRSNSLEKVGTACIYDGIMNGYIYPDLMMKVEINTENALVKYVYYVLTSKFIRNYYMSNASGTSQSMPKINQKTVANTPIPLPPLAEQKRIVLQVEKLMKVCDELEKLVEKSQKEESLLMGSIMNGLVG